MDSALLRVVDVSVTRAQEILDTPQMDITGEMITPENRNLAAENVKFSYEKRKVIDGISAQIPEKTTTAIVGPSGGGKTTLVNLLARFWDVDPENENDLMKAIQALTEEKTVIMIAHRLKTVEHADQILVVDHGKIVQQGAHENLMKEEGIYRNFISERREAASWKVKRS